MTHPLREAGNPRTAQCLGLAGIPAGPEATEGLGLQTELEPAGMWIPKAPSSPLGVGCPPISDWERWEQGPGEVRSGFQHPSALLPVIHTPDLPGTHQQTFASSTNNPNQHQSLKFPDSASDS